MAEDDPKKKAEDLAKLEEKLKEIERLSKQLNVNINTTNLRPLADNAGAIEAIFENLTKQAEELGGDTDYLISNFQKLTGEVRNSSLGLQQSSKALKSLSSIAEELTNHQKGYNTLSSKDLEKLKDKVKIETDRLKRAQNLLKEEEASLQNQINSSNFSSLNANTQRSIQDKLAKNKLTQESILNLLQNEDITLGELNNKLKDTADKAKKIENALGLTGAMLKGISKIPLLGDIIDTDKALKAAREEIEKGGTKFSAMKVAVKEVGSQIITKIKDPLVITGFLIDQFVNALKLSDTATGDLAKDFNTTYNNAAGIREELIQIGNLSGNVALNARALQESMVAVGKALGSNARLNTDDLKTFTELREMAGYTNEELVGIQKLTLATGGNLKDNTKQFLGTVSALNAQNKLSINEKQLLKETANVSEAIKLSVGGTTEQLAKAAFQAKQFGINLEQADKMSESLLDFESSINNQISAELITGKQLNLEKARLLALNGDIAGSSAEILKQVGGTAEWTKMNRIQQEALAKAAGLNREELAKSLVDREALAKLGGKEGTALKRYNELKAQGLTQEQIAAKLGDDQLATQLQQQSVQERLNQSVEKLKEIFVSIAEPVLRIISPIVDVLTPILSVISGVVGTIASGFGTVLKFVTPLIAGLGIFLVITKSILAIQKAWIVVQGLYNAMSLKGLSIEQRRSIIQAKNFLKGVGNYAIEAGKAVAGIPVVGPILAIAAITAAVAGGMALYGKFFTADDMISPGYGNRILSTPEGSIALNNKDTVIAGTNLGENKPTNTKINSSPDTKTVAPSIDLSPLLAELQANKAELQAIKAELAKQVTKPTIIENNMNGTKFGTATAMSTYKTQ